MRAELEDEEERRFWRLVLRITGTSLSLVLLLGASSAMAILLGWSRRLLPCALGLAAGAALSMGMSGSPRSRALTAVVLGTVTLPALAAHLAAVGAGGEEALSAYGALLVPFLANACAATLAGLAVAALWRRRPSASEGAGEAPAGIAAPAEAAAPPAWPAPVEPRNGRPAPPARPTTRGAVP